MGGQAGNTSAMRGGGAGNPAAPYAGLPQSGMAANRASMGRRFGGAMRPPGGGLVGGGGTQGPGGIAGPNDMATAGGTPGFNMRPPGGQPPSVGGFGMPGNPNDMYGAQQGMQQRWARGGMANPGDGGRETMGGDLGGGGNPQMGAQLGQFGGMFGGSPGNPGGQPDFSSLIQAMGQPKPMMQGGTGAMPMPGGMQSQPAPSQWNTTGRDQSLALLGSGGGSNSVRDAYLAARRGGSPYRPPGG